MNNEKTKKLLDIIRVDTDSLYWILLEKLKNLGMNPEFEHDDWIYVDNSHPIMLVAHIDTVTRNKKIKFKVKKDYIKARNSVLGADDRAGVFAIMEILERCKELSSPMPSVLFTNYEECGLIGVDAFVKSGKLNTNMNFFIELDRRGSNEYVYYSYIMPNEIKDYLESYGYVEDYGSISDVDSLTEEYSIPHVNLSVGYYNQHSSNEYLVPSELEWSIDRVFEMVENPIDKLYKVETYSKYGNHGHYYNGWGDFDDYYYKGYQGNRTNRNADTCPVINIHNKIEPISLKLFAKSDVIIHIPYEKDSGDIPWEEEPIYDSMNVSADELFPMDDEEIYYEEKYYSTYSF